MSEPVAKLGKYHILEQVGEGAMGVVYRALDPVLNRTVAIKVMSDGLAQDEALRARFLREAQAAGSLQHPNVVTIYDFGETDGHLFIAMEFIQGADLEHLLRHGAPLSLTAKLDIIVDVLNGLYYAHRRGIVHRDIKPANIRVDEEGHARIMDFGVARLATSDMTKSGVMMGTPNYMAPEQISGGDITAAVDIFSVGAVLYELLTNVKPFQGDTMHNVLFRIVTDTPPAPRQVRPDLPEALDAIVMRSIAKDPGDRFRTASEMANALTELRTTLGPPRISKTLSQRVSVRSEIDKSLRETRESHARAIAKRRWRMTAGAATGVAALLAITVFLTRWHNAKPPAAGQDVVVAGAPAQKTAAAPTTPSVADSTPASVSAADDSKAPQPGEAQRPALETAQPIQRAAAPSRSVSPPPRSSATRNPAVGESRDSAPLRVANDTAPPAAPLSTTGQQVASLVVAPSPTQPSAATAPPVTPPQDTTARPPAAPSPEPENSRPAIGSVVQAYARAIATRDVQEIRRVHAGMTPEQQSAWESFFGSVRSMAATFDIRSLDVNAEGNAAIARLSGVYEYVTRQGRSQRQPVALEALFARDGDRWRLQTIR